MQAVSWFSSGFHSRLSPRFATFILERKLKGDLRNVYKYLKSKENGARLFSLLTRADGHDLKYRSFPLDNECHSFTVTVTEHWQRLPRRGGEIFKLGDCPKPSRHDLRQLAVGGPAWAGDWTRRHPEISSNPNHSVIAWESKAVGLFRFWLVCNY